MGKETTNIKIEPLKAQTLSEFARLLKGYFLENNITPEFYRLDQDLTAPLEYYLPPHGGVWLAQFENSRQAAGMAAVKKLANRTCELKRLFVALEERHKGLGQKLLDQAMDFARQSNYFEILLSLTPQQKPALELFSKNGFKPCARYNEDRRAGIFYSYKFNNEVK